MKTKMHKLSLLIIVGCLAACGGQQRTTPIDTGSDIVMPDENDSGANASANADSGVRSVGLEDDASRQDTADTMIIYFEYDRSEVSPQYADILAGHARRMAQNPGLRLRLAGHADERGSREYNIGLGERRAQAVRRVLLISGASAGQISTVSYGEEQPASLGSSESDYQKNRRVELSWR
ncbi:MAG: peptidoglycan-associated lipoprotein Pal [Pseudomonadota bacterium]